MITWSQTVEREVESELQKILQEGGISRLRAAFKLNSSKPGWYIQTPEGEYLQHVVRVEVKAITNRQTEKSPNKKNP